MITNEINNKSFDSENLHKRIANNKEKLGKSHNNYVKLGMSNIGTIKKISIIALKILSCFTIILAPFVFYFSNKHLTKVAKEVIFQDNCDLIKQEFTLFDKTDAALIKTFYKNMWLKEGQYITQDSLNSIRDYYQSVTSSSESRKYIRKFHSEELKLLIHPTLRQCMKELIENQNNPSCGYPISIVDALISYYMAKRDEENLKTDSVFINQDGTTLPTEDMKDKIAFSHHLTLKNATLEGTRALTNLLENELRAHPDKRPAKVFVPYSLNIPGKTNHVVFLVIEPDTNDLRKANITMINTLGNSGVNSYLQEENLILEAAKSIYNSRETKTVKNQKATFSGPYCGIDCIENIRLLASVNDVQEYIRENKLPKRNQDTIALKCREHAADLDRILNL